MCACRSIHFPIATAPYTQVLLIFSKGLHPVDIFVLKVHANAYVKVPCQFYQQSGSFVFWGIAVAFQGADEGNAVISTGILEHVVGCFAIVRDLCDNDFALPVDKAAQMITDVDENMTRFMAKQVK